jgi:tRNA pseudouridine38-40 synthase
MRTFKLTIAYDGTKFAGWQSQVDQRTVQVVLQQALAKITQQNDVSAIASGRTDAGVHALGQVVSVVLDWELPAETLQRALASELPRDLVVVDAEEVPMDFHAIKSATGKRYQYRIHDGRVADVFRRQYTWHCFTRLDDAAMHRAAQALAGKHDFSSFEATGSPRQSSVRTIMHIGVSRDPDNVDLVTLDVAADGFLYKMVRTIIGSLVEVGRGHQDESWIGEILAQHDRNAAGPTSPPQGLFLIEVDY